MTILLRNYYRLHPLQPNTFAPEIFKKFLSFLNAVGNSMGYYLSIKNSLEPKDTVQIVPANVLNIQPP